MASQSAASSRAPGGAVWFNLAGIAIILALLGLGLAYALDRASRQSTPIATPDETVLLTLGGAELKIPRALMRYDEPAAAGFTDEIDLRFALPLGVDGAISNVDVTLVPRSRARPSASLLDGVYLHQFLPDQLFGPPGLVGKPLRVGDGFDNETVWYDALSADPFVAKCMAPVPGTTDERCLRTVMFETVAAIYAFDAGVLTNWRSFDVQVEAILAGIGIKR